MKVFTTRWLAVTALLAAGTALAAQQSPPPTPPAGAQSTGTQQPTFRVTVDLVTTDVIVRDARGQFVSDLDKAEFEIFEDGVPQQVASLVLVHGGRVFNQQLPPPPAAPEGIILPPARPTNDAAGRIFILFIDDLHLDFKNTARTRDLIKKVKNTLIHQGDMFAIVSSGTSSIEVDLTYDLNRIDEAVKKVMGGALKAADIIQGPEGADGPSEVRYRAHTAFSVVYDMLRQLEKVQNRRKALIYVSNGYDFNPYDKSRLGEDPDGFFMSRQGQTREEGENDPRRQGQQFADADLARELAELTRTANRANATIYTLDPRGLVGMPDIDENVDPTEFQEYINNSISSLRVLADQTGGIAVVNSNDFEKALKRIDAETSDYYMLGYYSTNPDPMRRTRNVDVKVKRKDVDVWSRKSYTLRPGAR